MDLDDSFTEGLLQNMKARRENLNKKKPDVLSSAKKRAAFDADAEGDADISLEESPKRQCTGVLQTAYLKHNKENIEMMDETTSDFIPYHSASKTRGLAALKKKYSNDIDDDVDFSNAAEQQETPTSSLAQKTSHQNSNEKSPQNVNLSNSYAEDVSDNNESINEDDFAENYDDIKSDDGSSNMETDFFQSENVTQKEKLNEPKTFVAVKEVKLAVPQENVKPNVDPAELPLSARRALFENAFINGSPKINDDAFDHKLSVAQRAAMFESAAKGNSGVKTANFKEPKRIAFSNFEKFETRNTDVHKSPVKVVQSTTLNNFQEIKTSPVKKVLETASPLKKTHEIASPLKKAHEIASPLKKTLQTASPGKKANSVSSTQSPTKNVGSHTRLIQQKLMESTGSNWQEKQAAKAADERKQEISGLVNHWEKLSSSSGTENDSESGKTPLASEEKNSYKSDTIYEGTESEHESELYESDNEDESKNISVEKESELSDNDKQGEVNFVPEETANKDFYDGETETGSLTSMEENIEQNYNDVSNHASSNNTRSFTSSCYSSVSSVASESNYHASNSQSCTSGSSVKSYDFNIPKTEEVFPEKTDKKENKIVVRTVSAYRREKQETKLTPVRTIVRQKDSSSESVPDNDFTEIIQQRLKELHDEVRMQQTVISQTSQFLNVCSAKPEFQGGSTEQVEGERLLLIATQKRQACLNEIQRLKTCGAQGENLIDGTGTLTITDIQLPLKREFISSQLQDKGTDTVHYFLCLIRHGAQVIVTQMVSTDERSNDGILSFTNHIQLRNLPANFSVVFEVYALQTKKDNLPHEKKYHIKRENSKKRLTPKGKKTDGKIPAICSPGGPNAVRSPSFGVVGFTRFNLQNCDKRTFTLDRVPFTSPLEGVLRVQVKLQAEYSVKHKGFLTFYEDVGEVGALYRRWCVLDGSHISYWLYPEDEHKYKKEPLGTINLRQCTTGIVQSVSVLECARSHTFKLVTVRPQRTGDRDTLISRTANTLTTTKYLLTADSKVERIEWCDKINEALQNVRKWDPKALRPVDMQNV